MSVEFNGAYSLGQSQRSKFISSECEKIPGPGKYEVRDFTGEQKYIGGKISKDGKRGFEYDNGRPGPGRINQEVESGTPAPNTYNIDTWTTDFKTRDQLEESVMRSTMRRSQSSSMFQRSTQSRNGFGGSERMKLIVSDSPGPGEYPPNRQSISRATSFGKSERNWFQSTNNPGPGAFDPKDSNLAKNQGCTLGQKLHDSLKTYETPVPGPGTYDGLLQQSKAGTKFGTESKQGMVDKESLKKPGPNYYYPLSTTFKIERQMIRHPTQPLLKQDFSTPGPDTYQSTTFVNEGPKWKMAAKLQKKNKSDFPGPGTYDQDSQTMTNGSERPRFGTTYGNRSNPVNSEFQNAGPGAYDVSGKISKSQFGITIGERFYQKKNVYEPGPGSYDIGGLIGKIPNYLMLAKKKHQQLLDFVS